MQVLVQNSYSQIQGIVDPNVTELLQAVMTYENDIESEKGQLFYQLKLARKYNNKKQYHMILAKIKHLEESVKVCLYKDGRFPTGLLNIALEALKSFKCEYQFIDQRKKPGQEVILRWHSKPWDPRYYQKEMIELGLASGRGVFEAAVGSGKSLVMANIIKEISVNTLVVVPSVGLSLQLYNDFAAWFGPQNVQLLNANKIRKQDYVRPISIVTIQSLGSLQKSGEFGEFASQINMLCCDELHHAGSATYVNLLKDLEHVYYRYGFTGTFLRNDNKTLELWSFLSNVLYEYPAWKATEEGFLTPMEVHIHTMGGAANMKYQTEYDNAYCGNPRLLQKIAEIITQAKPENQILILCNKKDKSGLVTNEYLRSVGIHSYYISGDTHKDEISRAIRDFNDKKIKVLIGTSVISEGIDIRSTDHLINIKGGKSEIVLTQALGRAIRKFEGKSIAYVHDFRFTNTNYMEKHLEHRIDAMVKNFRPKNIYES